MNGPTKPVMLEPGRWTIQREGESHSEAMDRLMDGEELDHERVPKHLRKLMDEANKPTPRFQSGGRIGS